MAISFVGSAGSNSTDGNNCVIDLTTISGLAQNDVVYICGIAVDSSFTGHAGVSGWTGVASVPYAGFVANGFTVSRKVMGSPPSTAATCAGTGDTGIPVASYMAMAFRGVDTTTPEDVGAQGAQGSGTATNPPSIDPVSTDCGIAAFGGHLSSTDGIPSGAPANYINLDSTGVNDTGSGNASAAYASWRLVTGSSVEDPGLYTQSTNVTWCSATIAMRPASAGTPGGFGVLLASHRNKLVIA